MKDIPIAKTRQAQRFSPLNATEIDELRSLVGQLNWTATQTHPDVSYEVLKLSIMKNHPQVDHLLRAYKAVRKLKREENSILCPRLGSFEDMEVNIYCAASWGNLPDGVSSAQGHIILLKGLEQRCCPIAWVSRKVKRHVPSTLAAEALVMHDALDEAIYSDSIMTELYCNNYRVNELPVVAYTDNKSLHENLHSTKQVPEK